MLLSRLEYN